MVTAKMKMKIINKLIKGEKNSFQGILAAKVITAIKIVKNKYGSKPPLKNNAVIKINKVMNFNRASKRWIMLFPLIYFPMVILSVFIFDGSS